MLTTLDKRFIQIQLTRFTNAEIADMLGKPEAEVHAVIDEMTGGGSGKKSMQQKQEERLKLREEKLAKKLAKKRGRRVPVRKVPVREDTHQLARQAGTHQFNSADREKAHIEKLNAKREKEARRIARVQANYKPIKKAEPKFETKQAPTEGKIAVRIDAKTLVFVKPGTDIEKIKAMYRKK